MEQQHFRQLLSSSASDQAAPHSKASPASGHQRLFGLVRKRRADGIGRTEGQDGGENELSTRRFPEQKGDRRVRRKGKDAEQADEDEGQSSRRRNGHAMDEYVDRAEARRRGLGVSNEYKDVERLRNDFEQRIAEAKTEQERADIRKQMTFLGGDEKHTILVKGLDFALLEQQKAKSGRTGANREEDALEEAFGGVEKRGKEVILQGSSTHEERERGLQKGKFVPIGMQKSAKDDLDPSPEYIWRDGKRMRKKKKTKKTTLETHIVEKSETRRNGHGVKSDNASNSAKVERNRAKQSTKSPTGIPERERLMPVKEESLVNEQAKAAEAFSSPPLRLLPATATATHKDDVKDEIDDILENQHDDDDDDDDEDIFAGAGRWQGVPEEDDTSSNSSET